MPTRTRTRSYASASKNASRVRGAGQMQCRMINANLRVRVRVRTRVKCNCAKECQEGATLSAAAWRIDERLRRVLLSSLLGILCTRSQLLQRFPIYGNRERTRRTGVGEANREERGGAEQSRRAAQSATAGRTHAYQRKKGAHS